MKITQEEIKDRVIDCIIKSAGDRLIVIRPENRVEGIDLIVKKKGEYKQNGLQSQMQNKVIKAQVFGVQRKKKMREISIKIERQEEREININNTPAIENLYLLFISFDIIKRDIGDDLYFIPFEKFKDSLNKSKFLVKKGDFGKILLGYF